MTYDRPAYTPDRCLRCIAKYIAQRAMLARARTPLEASVGARLVAYWLRESRKAGER